MDIHNYIDVYKFSKKVIVENFGLGSIEVIVVEFNINHKKQVITKSFLTISKKKIYSAKYTIN